MEMYLILGGCVIVVIFLFVFISLLLKGTTEKGMEKTLTKMGNVAVKVRSNLINNNEEILKETVNKSANINKEAVKTISNAIKEGFTENNLCYCRHCGKPIDDDSKFCKNCGKEQ